MKEQKFFVGDRVVVSAEEYALTDAVCDESIVSGGIYTVTELDGSGSCQLNGNKHAWADYEMLYLFERHPVRLTHAEIEKEIGRPFEYVK